MGRNGDDLVEKLRGRPFPALEVLFLTENSINRRE